MDLCGPDLVATAKLQADDWSYVSACPVQLGRQSGGICEKERAGVPAIELDGLGSCLRRSAQSFGDARYQVVSKLTCDARLAGLPHFR